MIIKRMIDGKGYEFKLTEMELFDSYCEQERIWDMGYVEDNLPEDLDGLCDNAEKREEAIGAIACEMRRQISKYDISQDYALSEAFSAYQNGRI